MHCLLSIFPLFRCPDNYQLFNGYYGLPLDSMSRYLSECYQLKSLRPKPGLPLAMLRTTFTLADQDEFAAFAIVTVVFFFSLELTNFSQLVF